MKKLLLVLIFGIANSVFGLTLDDIRDQLRDSLNDVDTTTTTQRWSTTELNRIINEGQRLVCDSVWCLNASSTIALVQGTTYYSLPTNHYVISRVVYYDPNSGPTVLPEKTIELLDREDAYWMQAATSTPECYYIDKTQTKIGLYPRPEFAVNIDIDYIKIPTDLSSDSDVPFDGTAKFYPYHWLLVYYSLWYCWNEDGQLQKANGMASLFTSGLQRMAQQIKVSPNYIPTFGVQR